MSFKDEKPLDFSRTGLDHLLGPEGFKECDKAITYERAFKKITDPEIILQARRMKFMILRVRDARQKKPASSPNPISPMQYLCVEQFEYKALKVVDFHFLLDLYIKTLAHNPEETKHFPRLRANGEFRKNN
ncbi:unnamed protein product [Caenorhabditis angaria]|uniref:Uncharacterized protein n=1 Tax=Caenorhabditis angaria TaxID=860376 RepID=A0A9P1J1Q7_9PELO|nr:unnamed protein product [Caenorhabditis angaria]